MQAAVVSQVTKASLRRWTSVEHGEFLKEGSFINHRRVLRADVFLIRGRVCASGGTDTEKGMKRFSLGGR